MSGADQDRAGQGEAAKGPRFQYQEGKLFLDKEGRWFHDGVEITHQRTLELFSRSVERDPAGGWRLVVGQEWAPLEVEDTPFMVREVMLEQDGVRVRLNDGTVEELRPGTIRQGPDNVLYCQVKDDCPARFLRPAYYHLMHNCLVEDGKEYGLRIGKRTWKISPDELPAT